MQIIETQGRNHLIFFLYLFYIAHILLYELHYVASFKMET